MRPCFFSVFPTPASYNTNTLIAVLDQLASFYAGQRVCKHDGLVVGFLAHTGLSLDS